MAPPTTPLADRFLAKIAFPGQWGACWYWTAATQAGGYGTLRWDTGRTELAHRISYRLFVGAIPDGHHLDHLCKVRHCVNPLHLDCVLPGENARRGLWAQRSHCSAGHAYTPANTVWRGTKRRCRICQHFYHATYRRQQNKD